MVAARRSSTKAVAPSPVKDEKAEDQNDDKAEIVLADAPPARKRQKRKSAADDDDAPPTSKKRKSTSTAVAKRGNVGKLARLNTISTDVFLVIAGFLQPIDLLHISRANRAWRELLLSSGSKQIWRAARSTLPGLPDCPSDLLEVQYAKLLFEHDCYRCGTRNVPKSDFCLRIRLCNPCARKEVFSKRRFKHTFPSGDPDILTLVPYTNTGAFAHGHASSSEFYHTPAVEKMQMLRLEKAGELDEAEFNEWLGAQEVKATKIRESGEEIEAWFKREAVLKHTERLQTGEQRKEEIFARLQERGHDPQDIKLNWGLKCYDLVVKPQQLTERTWQSILPKLEEAVEKNKEARLEREQRERARLRLDTLKSFYTEVCGTSPERPSPMDFYHLPSMIPVWLLDEERLLTRADFPDVALVRQEVEQFVAQIKEDLQRRLAEATVEEYPGREEVPIIRDRVKALRSGALATEVQAPSTSAVPGNTSSSTHDKVPACPNLNLATSVFACGQCLEPLHWPELLRHSHVEGTYGYYPNHTPAGASGPAGEWSKRWDPKLVTVSKAGILVMRGVLKAVDLSETSTPFALRDLKQRLACVECKAPSTWQHVFVHYMVESRAESAKAMTTYYSSYVLPNRHCPIGKDALFVKVEAGWLNTIHSLKSGHVQSYTMPPSAQAGPALGVKEAPGWSKTLDSLKRAHFGQSNTIRPSAQAGPSAPQASTSLFLTPDQQRAKTQKILSCHLCRDNRKFMLSSISSHLKDKHKVFGTDQAPHIIWP